RFITRSGLWRIQRCDDQAGGFSGLRGYIPGDGPGMFALRSPGPSVQEGKGAWPGSCPPIVLLCRLIQIISPRRSAPSGMVPVEGSNGPTLGAYNAVLSV